MNHVYAEQDINNIVTGSDAGSGINYSTSPFQSLLRGYVSVHLERVPVRDLVMITLGDGKIWGERSAVSLFT